MSVSTLRKWYSSGQIPSKLETEGMLGGRQRLVDLGAVRGRAGRMAKLPATSTPPAEREGEADDLGAEARPGGFLVPRDAWDSMVSQLGNLHQAGQDLAEARERAAKAETEAAFLRDRLTEMRSEVDSLRSGRPAPPAPGSPRRRWWQRRG